MPSYVGMKSSPEPRAGFTLLELRVVVDWFTYRPNSNFNTDNPNIGGDVHKGWDNRSHLPRESRPPTLHRKQPQES